MNFTLGHHFTGTTVRYRKFMLVSYFLGEIVSKQKFSISYLRPLSRHSIKEMALLLQLSDVQHGWGSLVISRGFIFYPLITSRRCHYRRYYRGSILASILWSASLPFSLYSFTLLLPFVLLHLHPSVCHSSLPHPSSPLEFLSHQFSPCLTSPFKLTDIF